MPSYYDPAQDAKYTRVYTTATPDIHQAFGDFNRAVFASEGRQIPLKYRELIALAVALTTQCAHCIDAHSKNAVAAGANEAELAETTWVAAAIRAGGAYTHGRTAFRLSGVLQHGVDAGS